MFSFRNEKEAEIGLAWINDTFVVFSTYKCELGVSRFDKPTLVIPSQQKQYTTSIQQAVTSMGDYLKGYRLGVSE